MVQHAFEIARLETLLRDRDSAGTNMRLQVRMAELQDRRTSDTARIDGTRIATGCVFRRVVSVFSGLVSELTQVQAEKEAMARELQQGILDLVKQPPTLVCICVRK
jgi:hypothetical protein